MARVHYVEIKGFQNVVRGGGHIFRPAWACVRLQLITVHSTRLAPDVPRGYIVQRDWKDGNTLRLSTGKKSLVVGGRDVPYNHLRRLGLHGFLAVPSNVMPIRIAFATLRWSLCPVAPFKHPSRAALAWLPND